MSLVVKDSCWWSWFSIYTTTIKNIDATLEVLNKGSFKTIRIIRMTVTYKSITSVSRPHRRIYLI